MTRRRMSILSLAVLAPLAVDPDSSVTSFMIAAGGGTYVDVSRGCQGEVLSAEKRAYRDVGFGASHKFKGPYEVGLRATVLRGVARHKDGAVLWNPNFSIEGRKVGFGLGVVTNTDAEGADNDDLSPVSGHLRFGSLARTYISVHVSEDLPTISGSGGAVRLGLGGHPVPAVNVWLGMGSPVPYDQAGFVLKTTVHVGPMLDLYATGRLGEAEGVKENAGAVGLTLRLTHDRK